MQRAVEGCHTGIDILESCVGHRRLDLAVGERDRGTLSRSKVIAKDLVHMIIDSSGRLHCTRVDNRRRKLFGPVGDHGICEGAPIDHVVLDRQDRRGVLPPFRKLDGVLWVR